MQEKDELTQREETEGERERERRRRKGEKRSREKYLNIKSDKFKLTGRYKEKYERRNRYIC